KSAKKGKKIAHEPTPEVAADADDAPEENEDDDHLHGFSTDDDDSSDEELAAPEADGLDISQLPMIAKDDASVQRRLKEAKRQPTEDKGVIVVSRLPHGFYEDQMKGYFSQFGDITRIRLSRSKKTGRSKHYAFIEFDSSSVAKIVAETMHNYLLMGHLVQCEAIPKDKVHPELWVGANRKWQKIPAARLERLKHDKPRTEEEIKDAERRIIKRQNQKKRKLEEAGIKYDFDAVAYVSRAVPHAAHTAHADPCSRRKRSRSQKRRSTSEPYYNCLYSTHLFGYPCFGNCGALAGGR
ncbi:RNA-binding domain-containing protein, partial [Athelia psychrophila]